MNQKTVVNGQTDAVARWWAEMVSMSLITGVTVGSKIGQIGPKWDTFGTS